MTKSLKLFRFRNMLPTLNYSKLKINQQNALYSFLNVYHVITQIVLTHFVTQMGHQGTQIKQYCIKHSLLLYIQSTCSAYCRSTSNKMQTILAEK
jgi:hypothetical protein